MENVFRFLVYVLSGWISSKYAVGHWVMGPVFGLAVVSLDSNNFKNVLAMKHLSFLAASTLIYALVYQISTQNWNRGSDLLDSTIGSLPIAVITGSVLLPLVHKVLLKADFKRVITASALLILSFYLITFISLAHDKLNRGGSINFLAISIFVWQGLYLTLFFLKRN